MNRFTQKMDENYPHITDFCGEMWAAFVIALAVTAFFTGIHAIMLNQFDTFTYTRLWVGSASTFFTMSVLLMILYIKESPRRLNPRRAWAELFWTRVYLPAVDHTILTEMVKDDFYVTGRTFWFRDRNEGLRVKLCTGIDGGTSA
jgi:hypothetical protein